MADIKESLDSDWCRKQVTSMLKALILWLEHGYELTEEQEAQVTRLGIILLARPGKSWHLGEEWPL